MPYKDSPLKEVKELLEKLPPNVWIRVYYGNKERRVGIMKPKKTKSKYTLNQVCTKLDQIGDAIFEFIKTTNARFDGIDARLDYNGLKKLPKNR